MRGYFRLNLRDTRLVITCDMYGRLRQRRLRARMDFKAHEADSDEDDLGFSAPARRAAAAGLGRFAAIVSALVRQAASVGHFCKSQRRLEKFMKCDEAAGGDTCSGGASGCKNGGQWSGGCEDEWKDGEFIVRECERCPAAGWRMGQLEDGVGQMWSGWRIIVIRKKFPMSFPLISRRRHPQLRKHLNFTADARPAIRHALLVMLATSGHSSRRTAR